MTILTVYNCTVMLLSALNKVEINEIIWVVQKKVKNRDNFQTSKLIENPKFKSKEEE